MRAGEIYPSNNAQLSPCYQAIAAMDQDNNAPVLRQSFSPDAANQSITATRCTLANGLEIAILVISERVSDIDEFTVTDSRNALSFLTPDERTLFFANMRADKIDAAKNQNGFGEGEIP